MSIAQAVQDRISIMAAGQVFGYQELPDYARTPMAVIKAVNRLVAGNAIERLSKGKFYVPQRGLLGARKPSDSELIRSVLYRGGQLRGYITGLALFNRLGLTTQIPRTVTVAINGGRQEKDFGTIRIKTVITRFPIREEDVPLLQYLDVLRDIKKIPDADINQSFRIMQSNIVGLSAVERIRLVQLAVEYYGPQVRALLGLLMESSKIGGAAILKSSLNPTTVYKLSLNSSLWPAAKEWNIQ